jgi:F-type H+-transporting ATPase subunit epsilon
MSLSLTIVTPEGEAFSGPVESVVLPGSEGDFGVLPRHERLLASLREGQIEIRTAGGARSAKISEGFADVSAEEVVVMVTSCSFADSGRR